MDLVFADDSFQKNPSRPGISGSLIAFGGVYVRSSHVGRLEKAINVCCDEYGFPAGEPFKWSPHRESFQYKGLTQDKRKKFFNRILDLAKDHEVRAIVVITDNECRFAVNGANSHEEDAIMLFLERCDWAFQKLDTDGFAVLAKPSGGKRGDIRVVSDCLKVLQEGTRYRKFNHMPIGVVSAQSKDIRLLQLADLVTSCSVSRVSGESKYSPDVFTKVCSLFDSDGGRIGGIGLKIHPDAKYVNLYHWLLNDDTFWKGNSGYPLPLKDRPFCENPISTQKMNLMHKNSD